MNDLSSTPTPLLAHEAAQRWRFAGHRCPECHAALYQHQALAPLQLGYERCPACRMNFCQRNGILDLDRTADAMLDELARRMPLISWPTPMLAAVDPDTGEIFECSQPQPW